MSSSYNLQFISALRQGTSNLLSRKKFKSLQE